MYSLLGARIAYRPAEITFPSGAVIKTGHLKDDQAYTKYQGHEYQRILIEELTQVPDEKRYLQLLASCRSTVEGIKPQVFNTTNPGGVGHGWVKRRFIDPAIPNTPIVDATSTRSRIYIPAKIDDNPTLLEADPGYVNFLESLKNTDVELWKAWRLGDWDTFAGQFFKEFRRDLHVCRPFMPDKQNIIVGGMDWGRTAPFAFILTEIIPMSIQGTKFYRAKTFLEVYGTDKTPKQWADIIKDRIKGAGLKLEDISWIQGDPAMFTKGQDSSISIADQFLREELRIKPASNDRIGGWENLHNWLSLAPDGLPYWQISDNCINLIRTLPELVHDDNRVEDVDTDSEDHACFCPHTLILTRRGTVPIIQVTIKDKVWTPLGWSKVIALIKQPKARLYDFHPMKVTSNHPFLTQDGFRQLKDLNGMIDRLWNVSISSVSPTGDIQLQQDFPIRSILDVVQRRMEKAHYHSIPTSGHFLMVLSLKAIISIIKTATMIETIWRIWSYTLVPTIFNRIGKKIERSWLQLPVKISKLLVKQLTFGMGVKKDSNFIQSWQKYLGKREKESSAFVFPVTPHTGFILDSNRNIVVSTVKCVCSDYEEVYNLETEFGMFTAEGVIVSNSDASRYQFKALKWIDAKVGAVKQVSSQSTRQLRAPQFIGDKQLSVDLEAWGNPKTLENDRGIGGIRH